MQGHRAARNCSRVHCQCTRRTHVIPRLLLNAPRQVVHMTVSSATACMEESVVRVSHGFFCLSKFHIAVGAFDVRER